MANVRCPHCQSAFVAEPSLDGRLRVTRCPRCDYPMSDPIIRFIRNNDFRGAD
jgi:hypothetical protein